MSLNMNFNGVKVHDIIIIGTGFSGIGMAIQLQKNGYNDFLILERGDKLGGTWRDNTYPGAACDVPSYLYSFSFEPNPNWTMMYSPQNEILDYNQHCFDKYNLKAKTRFNAVVQKAVFNEENGFWTIETNNEIYYTKVFIPCTGPLNKPQIPAIKGQRKFKGAAFHSSEWNHAVDLTNKRVAVIGTGASAIQVIPAIVNQVKSLAVFQRTPAWVMPKPDRAISPMEKTINKTLPLVQAAQRAFIYCTQEMTALAFTQIPAIFKVAEKQALKNIEKGVKCPEKRAKLTPNYTIGCKRILLSNDYYPALNQSKVEIITSAIDSIFDNTIQDETGKLHEVDVIIYATGFVASEDMAPFEVMGLEGNNLKEMWKDGGQAYLGTAIHNFPNAFMVVGPNTGLGHTSMIFMMESLYNYVLKALPHILNSSTKYIHPKENVQQRYNENLQKRMQKTIWLQGGCNSWYVNKDGINTTLWPGFTAEFRWLTSRFNVNDYEVAKIEKAKAASKYAKTEPI
jgi:cation diffusion facilitator CzcD-associated flavoprotein CzcO